MAIDIDTVTKLFDLLERLEPLQNRGTLPTGLATHARNKILEALEEIFPPPPPE